MKKLILALSLILILASGCTGHNIPMIESEHWQMDSIQSIDADGQIVACSPDHTDALTDANIILMECELSDGLLSLTDLTGNKTYNGTYVLLDRDREAINYRLFIGSSEGLAVTAMTTYHDGSQTPTLIISIDGYVLNFFPK